MLSGQALSSQHHQTFICSFQNQRYCEKLTMEVNGGDLETLKSSLFVSIIKPQDVNNMHVTMI